VARYHRTQGVCLRRIDYSNTSQIATFLTPDAGQLSFIAKGIRRAPKRGIRRGLELTARYDLVYFKRRSSSLYNLTEASMLEPFGGTRTAVERTLCAYYAAELMRNLTAEEDPCAPLYALLVETLRRLSDGDRLGLSVLVLELAALQHHGACPTFDACAECEQALSLRGRLLFSAPQGGPLCPQCGRDLHPRPERGVFPVRAERLEALATLAAESPPRIDAVRMAPRDIVAASRLLRVHIQYLLGKELRLWKYLHGRHLSRALRRIRRAAARA